MGEDGRLRVSNSAEGLRVLQNNSVSKWIHGEALLEAQKSPLKLR